MSSICRYRNVFGLPGKGVHALRFGGVAAVDLILTFLIAYMGTQATGMPITLSLVLWILISMTLHYVFCVQTSVMTYIGLNVTR